MLLAAFDVLQGYLTYYVSEINIILATFHCHLLFYGIKKHNWADLFIFKR